MREFVIVADGTCDLSREVRERFDIRVLPFHVVFPDGESRNLLPDWEGDPTPEAFYADLKKHPDQYMTSPYNIAEFAREFEEILDAGKDVLCLTISSGLSGTYGFATRGREEALAGHPEGKIYCVDTLRYSAAFGMMAVYASRLRAEGKTLEQTAAWLEENKGRFHQMGWLDDLSFVAKKGHLSHSKAFFGTLVGIKPLGDIDAQGMTTVLGKAKGEKAAYAAILSYIEATVEHPEEQIFFLAHSNRPRQAEELRRLVQERFSPKEILQTQVHIPCGINVGPGLNAVYYMGNPLTENLAEERALLTSFLEQK